MFQAGLRHWREGGMQEKPLLRFSEVEHDESQALLRGLRKRFVACGRTRLVTKHSQYRFNGRSGSFVTSSIFRNPVRSLMEPLPQPAFHSFKTSVYGFRSSYLEYASYWRCCNWLCLRV